jgi:Fe-S-cluster containining protein
MQLQATVPAGPARPAELLPLARAITDTVVAQTQAAVEAAGQRISCSAGCGACCRSLVAISEIEARRLLAVVTAWPELQRLALQARFEAALAALAQLGLLAPLQQWAGWSAAEYGRQLTAYFAAGVPCPFLEAESCSIYDERPLTCREFLVTSPPRHCAELGSTEIRRVALPVKMFNAMARWRPGQADALEPLETPPETSPEEPPEVQERWVPLVLALAWARQQPEETPQRTGPELLSGLLAAIDD